MARRLLRVVQPFQRQLLYRRVCLRLRSQPDAGRCRRHPTMLPDELQLWQLVALRLGWIDRAARRVARLFSQLRSPGQTPVVYQQGTYAPDSNYRWMGSIAMDKAGDVAVGYSVSSGQIYPQIHYTGRVPTDSLGTLETEKIIINGTGSQTRNLN